MATRKSEIDRSEELAQEFGENAPYVAELLARYRVDPGSVDEEWRAFFRGRLGEPEPEPGRERREPAAPAEKPAAAPAVAGERAALRGAALRIAENMEASLAVPTATSQRQIPIKVLEENRRLANEWREAHAQPKVSFTQWISWAIVRALKDFPRLNDAYDASGGPSRVTRGEVRFGLAVDVAKADGSRSLVVPNVKGAERMTFADFLAASDDVIARARSGRLDVKDFEGTTVSLTNPGTLGTTASVPRLMPGQSLIVATGAIEYPAEFAAMAPETLSRLAVSKVVTVTSTYDHRVVQGAESGAFLGRIEELLRGEQGFYEGAYADLAIPFKPYHWAVDRAFHDDAEIAKQARVLELINAYRVRGHLIADIDPLGLRPTPHHPELDLETYGLTIWDLDRSFWTGGLAGGDHMPLRDIVALMRRVYCGRIGTEYRHISSPAEKYWIRKKVAAAAAAGPLDAGLRRKVLEKLTAAETFERFLGTRFLGQRRYSIEGCETAIVFLDRLVEGAAARDVDEIVLGMAHRGRLNILANVVGNAAERIFAGFEGTVHPDFPADEGDVKYHQGARARRTTESGREITITVPSNPSHLEAVDPVVEGMARAKQDRQSGSLEEARRRILPVLIHGDAAFAGQGPVVETLNLAMLAGYTTGGTVHLVINNQIGFTTDPRSGRSSVYSTDVAKINQTPIFHVNGDDPEAALKVLDIALDYRQEQGKDVVVDLLGFRLHGHSEGDEPTYTQPLMYRRIQEHPGVRKLYADRLVREGVLSEAQAAEIETRQHALYEAALASAKGAVQRAAAPTAAVAHAESREKEIATGVSREVLGRIGRAMSVVPSGFNLNPKMVQQLARRSKMADGSLPLDWGTAEGLAFGSLLVEGTPIRISGEDTSRGTFAQRQAVLHDTKTGQTWTPLASIEKGQAPLWIYDSPLSEFGVLGFEYGYSVEAAGTFVLWEAQYGDFANGAQVILDQFVASAEDKWKQTTRMALLLPHGFEGQGPEHSSARIERYLQLCAEDNMRVCDVTTPAQYFHVLRRQMRAERAKPLVLFTPKSLLRLPASFSNLAELAEGAFRTVLGEAGGGDRSAVRRLLFCSGKVFYDLEAARQSRKDASIAVLRLEQLYPFPAEALAAALGTFPSVSQAVWVQEEPQNMGPWSFVEPRLKSVLPSSVPISYAGRAPSASPATGNAAVHKRELAALLDQALAS